MATHFDEKIMNFDVADGYDAFINLFTFDDIWGMIEVMDSSYTLHNDPQKMMRSVITAYVREWLVEQINYGKIRGTRHLFDIWMMVN